MLDFAHLDENGISLSLHRTGADDVRQSIRMHFHYGLFADILRDLAKTVSSLPASDLRPPRSASRRRAGPLFGAACRRSRQRRRHVRLDRQRGSAASPHHGIAGAIEIADASTHAHTAFCVAHAISI
jgi:hypothetical protein